MHANQMPVAGQPHIAFHTVGALFEREIVGGQRVFGASGRSASVGNNKGMPSEHLVGPRHNHYAAGSCGSGSTGPRGLIRFVAGTEASVGSLGAARAMLRCGEHLAKQTHRARGTATT